MAVKSAARKNPHIGSKMCIRDRLAHYLATGQRETPPPLGEQLALNSALYGEMLGHYGHDIGLRHARKHLGWALDAAAVIAGAPVHLLKMWRSRVLTATDPPIVLRRLAEAFDALGAARSANRGSTPTSKSAARICGTALA